MTNQITQAEFNGHLLPIIDHEDDAWFTAESIGQSLEYDNPRQSIVNLYNKYPEDLDEYSIVIKVMTNSPGNPTTRLFNEEGVMILCMLSRQPKAREFRKWAVQVLKAVRKTGRSVPLSEQTAIKMVELMQQMVTQFGQVHQKLMDVLEANQRKPRRQLVSTWQATRVANLYRSGLEIHEISLKMNIAEDTVNGLIELFEVTPHSEIRSGEVQGEPS